MTISTSLPASRTSSRAVCSSDTVMRKIRRKKKSTTGMAARLGKGVPSSASAELLRARYFRQSPTELVSHINHSARLCGGGRHAQAHSTGVRPKERIDLFSIVASQREE